MVKKALPILAIVMTVAAGYLAFVYNRDEQMLKALKAKGADPSGMSEAGKKHWAKI